MSTTTLLKPANENKDQSTKPDFGNGRYSGEMAYYYDAMQSIYGIEPAKAEKITRQIGADAGAVFKDTRATIKVGKANKDNKATIADASKATGVTLTVPLSIVRAIQWAGEAGKNGVSFGHTDWKLCEPIQTWINELEVKAKAE